MRKLFFYVLLHLLARQAIAQNGCNYSLSGNVVCTRMSEELAFATIYCEELKQTFQANDKSHFYISDLCSRTYHFKIAYVGHKTLDTAIAITRNTDAVFNLQPENEIREVEIEEHQVKKDVVETLQKSELSGVELEKTRGGTLADALKTISGVNAVQTGPSISKPMIHGMYGNRVLIVNNGVRLEGQTWGADHGPEIDPFIATKLSVIKGPASIRYGMDAIAGVVLVDPKDMPHSRCMNGELNFVGNSNGRGGTSSGFLEGAFGKKLTGLSWRMQGTLRQSGSYQTPTYYLTNTAMKETNYSGTLAYIQKSFGATVFYSSFHTTIGIYAGSDVSNLNDLYYVFSQPAPIVKSEFSYTINREYQTVHHQLMKANLFYHLKKAGKLELTIARQENIRSEYGEDSAAIGANVPDDRFRLLTHTAELVWSHKSFKNIAGSMGANFMTQNNSFQGIDYRAVIPDYRNYSSGLFLLEKWNRRKLSLEAGARYDYKWMRAYAQDSAMPEKHASELSWQNFSGTFGTTYRFSKNSSLNSSLGTGWRPPSSIELYALGIHQSAASFEIGDTRLKTERSYNLQSYSNFTFRRFQAEIGGYFNVINNYIYLKPLLSTVTTPDGVYPAFRYTQADVFYTGADATIHLSVFKWLSLVSKTSIIYAYNRSIHDYLMYVPSNRFDNGITCKFDSVGRFRDMYAGTSVLVVSKQTRVPANSDYVPPPKGYALLNAEAGTSLKIKNQLISISFTASNILNTVYRDYLNRLRYYANDTGRNFTLRLKIPFSIFGRDT